jgi:histidine ammonia-lyase
MQFTATSTTAECQTLSNSMYVHSIPNNNDNQDIVSMGTNSGLLTKRVVENAYQVMAIHYIALVQAVDCLEMAGQLSPFTQEIYKEVRAIVPKFIEDTPKNKDIQNVIDYLTNKEINIL